MIRFSQGWLLAETGLLKTETPKKNNTKTNQCVVSLLVSLSSHATKIGRDTSMDVVFVGKAESGGYWEFKDRRGETAPFGSWFYPVVLGEQTVMSIGVLFRLV